MPHYVLLLGLEIDDLNTIHTCCNAFIEIGLFFVTPDWPKSQNNIKRGKNSIETFSDVNFSLVTYLRAVHPHGIPGLEQLRQIIEFSHFL